MLPMDWRAGPTVPSKAACVAKKKVLAAAQRMADWDD